MTDQQGYDYMLPQNGIGCMNLSCVADYYLVKLGRISITVISND